MELKPFIVKVPVTYIPSENQRMNGRHLSQVAKDFKAEVYNALDALNVDNWEEDYHWINPDYAFIVTYHFIINQSLWRRDTDNMIKMFQDVLFEWFGINDSYIVSVTATKFFAPSSPTEYIIAKVEPNPIDINLYEEKIRQVSEGVSAG